MAWQWADVAVFLQFSYNLFCNSASKNGQESGLIVVGVGVMDLCEERGGTGWKGQFRDERGQGWRFRVENEVRQSRRFGMSGMDAVGWSGGRAVGGRGGVLVRVCMCEVAWEKKYPRG